MTSKHKNLCYIVVLALLIIAPFFLSASLLNAAVKALIAALFALAFNLLMGQGGMLSFGHGAYMGLGAFATMHAMMWAERGAMIPLPLMPVIGALAGLSAGLIAGFFATKRTGTYFAMVTLAIAELLHSIAMRWTSVFGGEAGLSSMRMPFAVWDFGSTFEVYYLVLIWVVLSTVLLYLYTRTPFGRMSLAIRDNEMRVRFLGNDAHTIKTVMFAISAMFAGVAGSLLAITDESVSFALFDARVSSLIVLQSFIGGVGVFFGPVFGAATLTMFSQIISDISRSWLLYQGLLFIVVMMYIPSGLWGSLVNKFQNKTAGSSSVQNVTQWLKLVVAVLVTFVAVVFLVEMASILMSSQYAAQKRALSDVYPLIKLFGVEWNPSSILTWLFPIVLLVIGVMLRFKKSNTEIHATTQTQGA
jgi:branched-chain amino acid transport system permease protein